MGRPFGVPVYVSPSWFVVAALMTVLFAPTFAERLPGIGAGRYAVSFAFAVLLYLSVLVHELSHSVVAKRFGLPCGASPCTCSAVSRRSSGNPRHPGRSSPSPSPGPCCRWGAPASDTP